MEKECIICGDIFEAIRSTRKYCDRCQKNSKKAQSRMNSAIVASKFRMGEYDVPVSKICPYCGKEFLTARGRKYCSDSCERNYRMETNTCQFCGELLFPEVKTIGKTVHPRCKEAAYEAWARRKGWYRNCKHCGKEFLAKHANQMFCSQDCSRDFRREESTKLTEYTCCICKRVFSVPKNYYFESNPRRITCSDECKKEYSRRYNLWVDKKKKEHEEAQKLAEEKKFQEEVEKCGLCGFCKTSYKDCDLMKTNFRIKPKGARYKDSKIVECPLFKR